MKRLKGRLLLALHVMAASVVSPILPMSAARPGSSRGPADFEGPAPGSPIGDVERYCARLDRDNAKAGTPTQFLSQHLRRVYGVA